ncbi:hypothetical protein LTR37_019746 [Vermiconidia calcicola]|uniref:Uncharacterized protein n=1 Tax=Vermiconidia calcicola TaxID=1690605 RepID=A0ACC3MDD5_9PEZI|nr:hypothetical protein LTR37_019746 [Vermiconidia calcicola]
MQTDHPPTDLEAIENALANLRISSTSKPTQAVALLAEASKQSIPTRQQLADPSILRTLIEIIETSINDSLESVDVALRCIGNACIDNSAAREAVTNIGFSWASLSLRAGSSTDFATRTLTAKVLYNICSDCEPAQQQCYRDMLHQELIDLCARGAWQRPPGIELLLELLFWICSQKDQVVAQDSSTTTHNKSLPDGTLEKLISLPHDYHSGLEPEDFALLLETCLIFFRDPSIQRDISAHNHLPSVWRILQENESKISDLSKDAEEDRKLLVPLSVSLTWCLSDIAASPGIPADTFADMHIKDVVVEAIKTRDSDWGNERLAIAGCQVLGNLLWSGKSVASYVLEDVALQHAVLEILNTSQDVELLHSTAGLLVQLCRPSVEIRENIVNNEQAQTALGPRWYQAAEGTG